MTEKVCKLKVCKLKVCKPARPTATVLFAGFGGTECGLVAAGIDVVQRVELDEDSCAVNETNFGPGIICSPCEQVNLKTITHTDYIFASPPCQQFSIARSKKLAPRDDGDSGLCVVDYTRVIRPRAVIVENVPPYAKAAAFLSIVAGLEAMNYRVDFAIINAADYAVAQTRKRLIMRAVAPGEKRYPLARTHQNMRKFKGHGLFEGEWPTLLPWNGWYGAIADLIPTLPESQFAPWQIARLPITDFQFELTTLLVGGANTSDTQAAPGVGVSASAEPSFRLKAGGGGRTFLHRSFLFENMSTARPSTLRLPDEPCWTLTTAQCGRRNSNMPTALLCGVQGEGGELARAGVPTITAAHENLRQQKYRAYTVDTRPANKSPANKSPANKSPANKSPANKSPANKTRGWLEQCRVVAMTPRALARFQSFPDWFLLPEHRELVSKGIGNAVPPLLMQRVAETLPGVGDNP